MAAKKKKTVRTTKKSKEVTIPEHSGDMSAVTKWVVLGVIIVAVLGLIFYSMTPKTIETENSKKILEENQVNPDISIGRSEESAILNGLKFEYKALTANQIIMAREGEIEPFKSAQEQTKLHILILEQVYLTHNIPLPGNIWDGKKQQTSLCTRWRRPSRRRESPMISTAS